MINLNIDPKIYERFSEVIYVLSILLFMALGLGALYSVFLEPSVALALLAFGFGLYGFGWIVRFTITGKKNFLFESFIVGKLNKYIVVIKEKTK